MSSTSEENNINQKEKGSFLAQLLRFIAVMLILFVLLAVLLGLVVQDSDFQNWAVKKVTTNLSERLDTKVDLERVDIDFFNNLSFTNFYVEDYNKDTLLYTEQLDVDLNVNWRSLLKGRVSIDEISLTNGNIKIRRDSGQFMNNIQIITEKLKSKSVAQKQNKKRDFNSFDLNLDKLNFKDVCFVQNDGLRGQDIRACLDQAWVSFEDFKIDENLFNIDDISIDGVAVDIYEFTRNEELFNDFFELPSKFEVGSGAGAKGSSDSLVIPLVITVEDFNIKNGTLKLRNTRKSLTRTMPTTVVDYKNLDLSEIDLNFENLNYTEGQMNGKLASLSVKENSGFKINDLFIDDLLITDRKVVAKGYRMKTPYSNFEENLTLKFREFDDFYEFEDKVYINSTFKNTTIGINDIIYLAGALEQNEFLNLNRNESLSLNGKLTGKINNLKGSGINIQLGDKLTFNGNFNTRNLTVKNEEFVNLQIDQVDVAMTSLRQLIPNFSLPPNFDKLGNLNFNGNFTGFFTDFVAYGDLRTDLGGITSDVQLRLTEGIDKARYGGKLNLKDFDLATWTGDEKFGNVTISAIVKEGIGLRRDVASANLVATVEDFSYKDYKYENINLIGRLDKSEFDGDLTINDSNIDLDFGGKISFADEKPLFNFTSNVRNIDFQKLNLSEKNLVLSGDMDLNVVGDKLSTITGEIYLSDFKISMNDDLEYNLDTIALRSLVNDAGSKSLHLESELLNLDLNGQFELDKIAFAFQDYFVEKFPEYAERLEIFSSGKNYEDVDFDFDLEVFDSENLTYFIDTRIDTIRDMKASGYFNTYKDSLSLIAELPNFTFDDNRFENINILLEANKDDSELVLGVLNTILKKGQSVPAYSLFATASNDLIDFNFNINDPNGERYNMLINGILKVKENKVFELSLLPSNLTFVQQEWEVSENNFVRFGKDFIEIENFALSNGYQKVNVDNIGDKGIHVNLENFDLAEINKYTNYDKLFFDGDLTVDITAADIFKLEDFELNLNMDTLKIFEDDWGVLSLQAKLPSLNDKANAYLSLTKGEQQILAEGFYVIPNPNRKANNNLEDNYFDFDINSNAVPLSLLEYFIPSGLSNTVGLVDADIKLSGLPTDINSEGTLRVYDGAFDVDFLGTRYFVEDGIVQVTKTLLDGTGGIVKDKFGNVATLRGGVYHTNLKDMILDLTIDAPEFLALDTKKGDNELFYGIGIGKGTVHFAGPFTQTDITINAVTLDGTKMNIPIESDNESSELGFINFVKRETEVSQEKEEEELRGVNVLINLEVTEDTDAQLIFDEEAGDIVKGRGRGNIEITNKRTGEFSMYGNYEIEYGEYLFTYSYRDLVKLNKPFQVKRGGSIVWDGDPYTAQINLEAEYVGLRTSVYNLIAEFLETSGNDNLAVEARNSTAVNLSMFLKGDLFKPEINFQLDFPELAGELKGYVDSKMLNLSKDENELNRQVFGLIVIGSFLPSSDVALGSNEFVNFGINTVSQFLSNQLSLYISELLSDILADNGVFTRAEFNVNYSVYNPGEANSTGTLNNRASELSLQLKNYLFQERLAIKIGADFGIGDETILVDDAAAFNTFDVIVEWVITKDRRFKLVVYNKNDSTIFGPQRKSGFGASYRYEFETWDEFFNGFKKKTREAIKRDQKK